MKRFFATLLALCILCCFVGCNNAPSEDIAVTPPVVLPAPDDDSPDQMATLYAVYNLNADNFSVQEYELGFSGDLTPEILADGLTNLTGLQFTALFSQTEAGIVVDWSLNSTLIAGLGDTEQNENFVFLDNDSLVWFMLDSMFYTLQQNLGVENIYYTMNGGQQLVLENNSPAVTIAGDEAYLGRDQYL
jgi:hypothetical protein